MISFFMPITQVRRGNVPDYEANTATLYRMEKDDIIGVVKRNPDVYDLMNVVILRINDEVKPDDEVLQLLQTLCTDLLNVDEKLAALGNLGLRIEDNITKGVRHMCNLSDLVEARGIAQGIERGIERGIELGKKETVLNLLADGIPYEKASKYTDISVDLIKQWEREQAG